jgi:hypothetical protein
MTAAHQALNNLFVVATATELDTERKPILNSSLAPATPFSLGAGHVIPIRALDPGLVYDMATADYLNFLCALGYNASAMKTFNGAPYRCPAKRMTLHDLNYPSITALALPGGGLPTVRRRVKNVGGPGTYTAAVVQEPEGVQVVVTPTTLAFKAAGEEKEFEVSFVVRSHAAAADYKFGAIVWSDGVHRVRSPLVLKTQG